MWRPYCVSAVPAMTRFGTLAGRIAAERIGVASPTASTAPCRPGRPKPRPKASQRASTTGTSRAMRPRFDGITKATAKDKATMPAMKAG
ncbi:hypothetical protein CFIICLFH_3549 [Methylobacterium goesingense]|nr:hypothetical protein CFIICLFH_3549 [Methylobacterium goesingense]